MIDQVVSRYKELYEETELSTTEMVTKISVEFKLAEMTVNRIIRRHDSYSDLEHDLPVRLNENQGGKRRDKIIPLDTLAESMDKFIKQGYPVNRAAQATAIKLNCGRTNVLRRWAIYCERKTREGK